MHSLFPLQLKRPTRNEHARALVQDPPCITQVSSFATSTIRSSSVASQPYPPTHTSSRLWPACLPCHAMPSPYTRFSVKHPTCESRKSLVHAHVRVRLRGCILSCVPFRQVSFHLPASLSSASTVAHTLIAARTIANSLPESLDPQLLPPAAIDNMAMSTISPARANSFLAKSG